MDGVGVEVALQYTGEYTENVHSYVNNINTIDGGTHLSGFRTALTRTLNSYGKKNNLFKDLAPPATIFARADGRRLACACPSRKFEGANQSQAQQRRSRRHRQLGRRRFPGQLSRGESQDRPSRSCKRPCWRPRPARRPARPRPCSANAKARCPAAACPASCAIAPAATSTRCELYLVEGDSAGGSAEGGRLREYQAILPLRGKIINAYKSREDKVLANEEVRSMISAIGSRHRRGGRPLEAPLRQNRHHDRRRRRRLAHPHAAAHVLLSPDVPAGRQGHSSTSPSRRCSA